jgi:hypothetical protein
MDLLLASKETLDNKSWLYFKLYKDPASDCSWQNSLNWYHQTLITVVKPIVDAKKMIRAVFFGIYGQDHYDNEDEEYERQITPHATSFVFIRLRLQVEPANKEKIKNEFLRIVQENENLVWDYEVMNTFHVMRDIGSRFGSNNEDQTLGFVRYWDAGCRYILSILTMPGNWIAGVDVWGIPHLINNSIGAWLRRECEPVPCPRCQTHMYSNTTVLGFTPPATINQTPVFFFVCPNCGNQLWSVANS